MIRVYFHCVWKTATLTTPAHQMCYKQILDGPKRWFCSCGYLNNGITWKQEKEDK